MKTLALSPFETLTVACVFLLLGYVLQKRISLLSKYYLPAPAIGGVLGAILLTTLRAGNVLDVQLNISLQPLLFVGFFASIGFRASFQQIKSSAHKVLLFLGVTIVLAATQKLVGLMAAPVVGLSRYAGLTASAAHMDGGMIKGFLVPALAQHGNPAPIFAGVVVLSVVIGCFLGGPLFSYLQTKHNLSRGGKPQPSPLAPPHLLKHLTVYFVTLVCAMTLAEALDLVYLPAHALALIIAALWRNYDLNRPMQKLDLHYLNVLGNVSLSLSLSLVFINLNLPAITSLPIGVWVLVVMQIMLIIGLSLLTFKWLGGDLLAALVAAGLPGFSLGLPPDTMATLQCIQEKNGPVPAATFIVPVVGAWFILFINPWIYQMVASLL